MKVSELMTKLAQMPQHAEVLIEKEDENWVSIADVEKSQGLQSEVYLCLNDD